jgi:hypothetical protein
MLNDLRKSGLTDATIAAMQVEPVGAEACQSLLGWGGVPDNGGYKIPYFDLDGKPTGFFRVRFTPAIHKKSGGLIRYGQPKNSATRAYLPPLEWCRPAWRDVRIPIIITEGEKKAAKACQEGLLTVGLGGVNSWMRRKFRCKTERIVNDPKADGFVILELLDAREIQMVKERVAEELIDLPFRGREVFICFDNDREPNVRVQQAAFDLSVHLEERDVAAVVQLLLPPSPNGAKLGLDDFLMSHTVEDLAALPVWNVVPEDLRSWLREQLDGAKKLNRSGVISCGRAVSNSLLNNGSIYKDPSTGTFYYYSDRSSELHPFEIGGDALKQLNACSFGTLLHRDYALGATDSTVLARTFENLAHCPTIREVTPRRVSFAAPDALYYQLSNSMMARATAESLDIVKNGTDDVLFLSGQVAPLDAEDLGGLIAGRSVFPPLWLGAVEELLTLQPMKGLTIAETRLFLAALCYLNPWFRRWRGLSLPIEIFCAEPNSGKSYLLMLRRGILTGRQDLDLMAEDKGDWYANITHAPGMWCCDNIDQISRDMERSFSDALCSFVTQDDPRIKLRKLHVTNVLYQARVDCTFAFTCIRNPFHKPDIIQRSFAFALKAIPPEQRRSGWVDRKLEDRTIWIYDLLMVARRFLQAAREEWKATGDRSATRLKYFDQCLHLMGVALGRQVEMDALIPKLKLATSDAIAEADPMMTALRAFWENEKRKGNVGPKFKWQPSQIRARLLEAPDDRWEHVRVIKSAEAFGRYLSAHESDIFNSAGLKRSVEKNQTWIELREEID